MKKKKICIVTGSRAEWGLFYPLAQEIKRSRKHFTLGIIATGSHLSSGFGLTYKEIEEDGFRINSKVKIPLNNDTALGIAKVTGTAIARISEALKSQEPDLVFLLGDRFEILSAAIACLFLRLPIAHIHGGELTQGSLDDSIRHAITKMAHLHFAATDRYRRRIIQMGENPVSVFNVGALGLDNIKNEKLLDKKAFEKKIKFKLGKRNIMVTFHPSTSEKKSVSEEQFSNLLKVLDTLKDTKIIFTKPNPDMYSELIIRSIDRYVSKRRKKAISFKSMGKRLYLSALQFMDLVAGNSSSGIIEVPSFKIPTINIGNRQKGRIKADSVIDAQGSVNSIDRAFKKAFSLLFRNVCKKVKNPYGKGDASKKMVKIIKQNILTSVSKKFFDLDQFKRGG